MRHDHSNVGLGGMFSTLTALASPSHTALTGKPLYEHVSPLGFRSKTGGPFSQAVSMLKRWHERSRQRRQLSELSDQMLQDIGLTRAHVEHEQQKPFWQA